MKEQKYKKKVSGKIEYQLTISDSQSADAFSAQWTQSLLFAAITENPRSANMTA